MGSQSLASSIETAFALRIITPIAGLIVLLWLLSPIGGQSSLRLLSIQQLPEIGLQADLLLGQQYQQCVWRFIRGSLLTTPNAIRAIIAASLLAQPSTWTSPVDTWNNAKIPMIESFVQETLNGNDEVSPNWYLVSSDAPGILLTGRYSSRQRTCESSGELFHRAQLPVHRL